MTRSEIIDKFRELDITLSPAGIWKFDAEGRKEAQDAKRPDNLALDLYPLDNMYKFRIEQTPYLLIDIDGADIMDVIRVLPTVATTFTTTTTSNTKFHCYVQRPQDFPLTRVIGKLMTNVDVISNGIVFEGHMHNLANSKYEISNDAPVLSLSQGEIDILMTLVTQKQIANHKAGVGDLPRYNFEESQLIKGYLAGTLTKQQRNKLLKMLVPTGLKKEDLQSSVLDDTQPKLPKFSHTNINTMAYYIAMNKFTPHEDVVAFMEKLIFSYYNIDLNSAKSRHHWHKSILPTLPVVEVEEFSENFMKHIESAPLCRNQTYKLISTINMFGTLSYMQIHRYTLNPRFKNGVMLFQASSLQAEYPTLDKDNWVYGVPEVQITDNPFAPHTSYNEEDATFTLSTLKRTEYMTQLQSIETKPNNILTKAIAGIFKHQATDRIDAEEFYYYWLAHILFSEHAVTTIMCLASPANELGGSGKTTLTATLPMHIAPLGTITAINDSLAKWSGDAFQGRLASFDDLFESEKWKEIYTIIKQQTSNTIKRLDRKGKGTELSFRRTNISISANFIPKIDESDRRFFIWSPREKLSTEEGTELGLILKDFKQYRYEIQEIANYCYYLYTSNTDKYYNELYIQAPYTQMGQISKSEGGLGETLISRICAGPGRLFEDYVGGQDKWTDIEIAQFIVMVAREPNTRTKSWTIALPWNFYNKVLCALKADTATEYTKGRLALVMGKVVWNDFSPDRASMYKHKYPDFAKAGLMHNIEESLIQSYKDYIEAYKVDIPTIDIDGV
jgi:hypothetical protein